MLFSEEFNISKTPEDDWFDVILDNDTKIWIDPFFIFKDESDEWRGAHNELIAHFDRCFHLIAQGNRNPFSVPYQKALRLLTFPEPREFCLGYTEDGTGGAGGGKIYARLIASAMEDAIVRGLTDLRHFEELGILNEGIGPDRISDLTCNILRSRFILYTKKVVARHNIPTRYKRVPYASYDQLRVNWNTEGHALPYNRFNNKPILLTPARFLKELPVINAEEWWENYEAEQLRLDMNYDVLGKVNKKKIVDAARRNPEAVRAWVQKREQQPTEPYNLSRDKLGVYQWGFCNNSVC
jgi:hypothetical protein